MGQAYVERKKVVITGGSPYAIDISGNSKVGVITNGTWNGSSVGINYGGTGAATASNARTNLGLAIGSNVQAYSSTLDQVANGTYVGSGNTTTVGTVTTGTWNASVIGVPYGGTGANTLTGYVKANGTNPMTASSTIPATDVDGFSNAVSNLVSTVLAVSPELSLTYDSGNDTVTIAIDDPTLLAVSNGTYTGDDSITTLGTVTTGTWNASTVAIAYGGTGATTASGARTNLGLAIGTNVQAYDAELAALAGVTSAADKVPYFTGSGTANVATFTSYGRSLVATANSADARTTLGVVIGTDVQAYDAELAALAGVTSAADKLPYFTGSGTANVTTLTSYGRDVIGAANAAGLINTLGLGTMSLQNANNVSISGGTITANSVTVSGNLVVNGTTTTLNSTELSVDDKNITLADTASPSDASADGGGITLKGTTDKTFNWVSSTGSWTASENMDVAAGKVYKIGGTSVLSNTTLGSGVVNSSLTSVGTLTSGTWNASTVAIAYGGTGATTASGARTNLGLVIGTDVQAYDAELAALAGVTSAADKVPYFTGSGTANVATFTSYGRSLVATANSADARTTLGVVIGTDVQAYDAELAALAGVTSAADKVPYFTGSGTANVATFTSYGRSLVATANSADARTTLGVVIGTDVQAYDAELAALAGVTSAADKVPYFTGSGTANVATFTSYGRSLVATANSADARTTLGLVIGTDVQAYNSNLSNVASGSYVGSSSITTLGTVTTGTWNASTVAVNYGGTGATNATNARTNLGVAIGTDVQAYNSTLSNVANGTYVGANSITTLGTVTIGTWNASTVAIAYGGTGATNASGARTNLGLVIGTDVQAYDAELAALAGVTSAADKVPYFTGSGTANVATLTSYGRDVIGAANASALINTLGLGTMSLQNANNVSISGGTITASSVTVSGNLVVNGTTTTLNSTELSVDDKNITLADTASPSDASADGGGITLKGTTDKTFNWVSSTGSWTASENMDVAAGKVYKVGGTSVLSNTTLGSGVVNSSLTSVGILTSGTWNASTVAIAYGGTGANTASDARTNLGLAIGTNVQAYDAELAALAGLASAANTVPYFTGSGTAALATLTPYGRDVIGAANSSALISTLGLGTMSLQNANNVAVTGGTLSGITNLSVEGVFNSGVSLATDTYSNAKVSVRTPLISFKTVAETNLFTVPAGYMFLIDTMEVLTTAISGAGTAPNVRFGNSGDSSAYYSADTTLSNSAGSRHVIDIPQDAAAAGTVVTFGISSVSSATSHTGCGIVTGYLVKL